MTRRAGAGRSRRDRGRRPAGGCPLRGCPPGPLAPLAAPPARDDRSSIQARGQPPRAARICRVTPVLSSRQRMSSTLTPEALGQPLHRAGPRVGRHQPLARGEQATGEPIRFVLLLRVMLQSQQDAFVRETDLFRGVVQNQVGEFMGEVACPSRRGVGRIDDDETRSVPGHRHRRPAVRIGGPKLLPTRFGESGKLLRGQNAYA